MLSYKIFTRPKSVTHGSFPTYKKEKSLSDRHHLNQMIILSITKNGTNQLEVSYDKMGSTGHLWSIFAKNIVPESKHEETFIKTQNVRH